MLKKSSFKHRRFTALDGFVRERERIRSWKLRPHSGEDPGTGTDPELEAPATFWGGSGNEGAV